MPGLFWRIKQLPNTTRRFSWTTGRITPNRKCSALQRRKGRFQNGGTYFTSLVGEFRQFLLRLRGRDSPNRRDPTCSHFASFRSLRRMRLVARLPVGDSEFRLTLYFASVGHGPCVVRIRDCTQARSS